MHLCCQMSETIQPSDSTTGFWIFSIYHHRQLTCIAKVVIKMLSDCLVYYTTVQSLSSGKSKTAAAVSSLSVGQLFYCCCVVVVVVVVAVLLSIQLWNLADIHQDLLTAKSDTFLNCLFSSFCFSKDMQITRLIIDLIYRIIVARLVDSEPIITNELGVVTTRSFDSPVEISSGEIHAENAEFLPIPKSSLTLITD